MTQQQPEIPDSISSEQLQSLLSDAEAGGMPLSSIIPVLPFGTSSDDRAGLLDLFLVVLQIVARAKPHGPNPNQMLACASGLLHGTISKLNYLAKDPEVSRSIIDDLRGLKPGITVDDPVITAAREHLLSTIRKLDGALTILQAVEAEWCSMLGLGCQSEAEARKRLVSDAIVQALNLDREAVDVGLGLKS